jgi:hypothetical protein
LKYSRLCAAALFVLTALFTALVHAEPSSADRVSARSLAVEGHRALRAGDFTTAADRFARADGLVHAPTLLLGLARAQVGLGKLVAAQDSYARILREGSAPGAPQQFAAAVKDAGKESGALAPRLAWVTVTVSGAADPKVVLDGETLPSVAIGAPRAVDPGQHAVSATAAGAEQVEATMTLAEGEKRTVPLELKPVPPAPIVIPPAAPPPAPSLPAPAPLAVVESPAEVPVAKGSTRRTAGFVLLAAGGAGLVLGSVTGGLAIGAHASTVGNCPGGHCPATLASKVDSYNALALVSTIGFIAGGGAAGLGVVLIATAPANGAARIGVIMGPGSLGAVGSF